MSALTILGNSTNEALRFVSFDEEEVSNGEKPIEYFSLSTKGCYFYNNKINNINY
jgi:hypothetical protein